jgi:hypothetical protein
VPSQRALALAFSAAEPPPPPPPLLVTCPNGACGARMAAEAQGVAARFCTLCGTPLARS